METYAHILEDHMLYPFGNTHIYMGSRQITAVFPLYKFTKEIGKNNERQRIYKNRYVSSHMTFSLSAQIK